MIASYKHLKRKPVNLQVNNVMLVFLSIFQINFFVQPFLVAKLLYNLKSRSVRTYVNLKRLGENMILLAHMKDRRMKFLVNISINIEYN